MRKRILKIILCPVILLTRVNPEFCVKCKT